MRNENLCQDVRQLPSAVKSPVWQQTTAAIFFLWWVSEVNGTKAREPVMTNENFTKQTLRIKVVISCADAILLQDSLHQLLNSTDMTGFFRECVDQCTYSLSGWSSGSVPQPRTIFAGGFQPMSSSWTCGWLPHSVPWGHRTEQTVTEMFDSSEGNMSGVY